REMGVFGGPYDALASAFWEDQVRPGFSAKTVGSSVQISRQVTRATRTLYSYSLRDVDESKAPALIQATTLRLSSLTASTVHDTRDALFDPMRGHYVSGELQLFGQTIGSEADFAKLYAQAFFFREILPKTVWAQAVRAGAAYTYGRTRGDPAATGDAVSGLPPSERFFAGGDTTLRGFKRDRVGTLDASGDPLGGEGLFLLNEELRFPIFQYLQGVVFYDAGNIYRTIADYDITDLRQVAGAGLRIATPIGPFRFEYGAILDRRQSEAAGQFFISIGQAF
ncbi:MAG TPA: BamA/TamA family outer membrane protein, partial [Candidatus Polarisedimenticolia bacterium]|nr:BamA/TamA family outer membrane protein [Candidatus Polarisedimenticolia bacterium]